MCFITATRAALRREGVAALTSEVPPLWALQPGADRACARQSLGWIGGNRAAAIKRRRITRVSILSTAARGGLPAIPRGIIWQAQAAAGLLGSAAHRDAGENARIAKDRRVVTRGAV